MNKLHNLGFLLKPLDFLNTVNSRYLDIGYLNTPDMSTYCPEFCPYTLHIQMFSRLNLIVCLDNHCIHNASCENREPCVFPGQI